MVALREVKCFTVGGYVTDTIGRFSKVGREISKIQNGVKYMLKEENNMDKSGIEFLMSKKTRFVD